MENNVKLENDLRHQEVQPHFQSSLLPLFQKSKKGFKKIWKVFKYDMPICIEYDCLVTHRLFLAPPPPKKKIV